MADGLWPMAYSMADGRWPMTDARCLMTDDQCDGLWLMPDAQCTMSDVRCLMPDAGLCPMIDGRWPTSYAWCPMPDALRPEAWHMAHAFHIQASLEICAGWYPDIYARKLGDGAYLMSPMNATHALCSLVTAGIIVFCTVRLQEIKVLVFV